LSDLVRVRKWTEFKRLVKELKPDSIVYSIDQNAMSKTKELTALRLILLAKGGYHVYLDFPKGKENVMRETGIQIHEDENGVRYLTDEDVVQLIKRELGENLQVFSFWTT
jgi:predicted ATP-dependent endonuclease of OLD family